MTVRAAEPGDGRRIEQIRVAGWHSAYAGLIDADWLSGFRVTAERAARWHERIATPLPGAVILVAEQGGVVQGFAATQPCRDDDLPDAFELAALHVDPAVHRKGVGTALLQAALEGRPRPQVLWVLEGNDMARRFYEIHGFAWDGNRKLLDLPGEPPEVRYRQP